MGLLRPGADGDGGGIEYPMLRQDGTYAPLYILTRLSFRDQTDAHVVRLSIVRDHVEGFQAPHARDRTDLLLHLLDVDVCGNLVEQHTRRAPDDAPGHRHHDQRHDAGAPGVRSGPSEVDEDVCQHDCRGSCHVADCIGQCRLRALVALVVTLLHELKDHRVGTDADERADDRDPALHLLRMLEALERLPENVGGCAKQEQAVPVPGHDVEALRAEGAAGVVGPLNAQGCVPAQSVGREVHHVVEGVAEEGQRVADAAAHEEDSDNPDGQEERDAHGEQRPGRGTVIVDLHCRRQWLVVRDCAAAAHDEGPEATEEQPVEKAAEEAQVREVQDEGTLHVDGRDDPDEDQGARCLFLRGLRGAVLPGADGVEADDEAPSRHEEQRRSDERGGVGGGKVVEEPEEGSGEGAQQPFAAVPPARTVQLHDVSLQD